MGKHKKKLRDVIESLPNADKDSSKEKWYKGRNKLDLVHPFRLCSIGIPNSGKSTIIKYIVLKALEGKAPFEKIDVVHFGAGDTREYDVLEPIELLDELPDPKDYGLNKDVAEKWLLIVEDLDLGGMSKEDRSKLNRLVSYCSSHRGISMAITCQTMFDVPPPIRRVCNVFCLFRCPDINSIAMIASRVGMKKKVFMELFRDYVKDIHDSLMIDLTPGTPYPLRKNGFQILKQIEDDE